MKTILVFDTPDTDERDVAIAGAKWRTVAFEMEKWLRDQLKYGDPNDKYDSPATAIGEARVYLHDAIRDQGLELA